jgi:hypothetical protein
MNWMSSFAPIHAHWRKFWMASKMTFANYSFVFYAENQAEIQ